MPCLFGTKKTPVIIHRPPTPSHGFWLGIGWVGRRGVSWEKRGVVKEPERSGKTSEVSRAGLFLSVCGCTHCTHWLRPRNSPPPAFVLIYEGAIGQPRQPSRHSFVTPFLSLSSFRDSIMSWYQYSLVPTPQQYDHSQRTEAIENWPNTASYLASLMESMFFTVMDYQYTAWWNGVSPMPLLSCELLAI